jgi:hypothetical protein
MFVPASAGTNKQTAASTFEVRHVATSAEDMRCLAVGSADRS